MKILVTGATGFIGSHLVERLIKQGHEVNALVKEENIKNNLEARKENLELLKKLNVRIFWGNLLNKNSLKKAVEDVGIIFHLAAIARPMEIPDKVYFEINEKGTQNLLEACKDIKIKKIIIMSSVSAVGPSRDGLAVNEKSLCKPNETYGWSKLAQEKVGMKYFEAYKLPIVFLRPPMVFGPRDFEMLRLFKIINKKIFPLSSNNECMEFLYVENLVEACLLAMKHGKNGEKYHISNEKHYSINEIVNSISKAEGKKVIPLKLPKFFFVIGGYCVEFISKIIQIHPPFKHDTVKWMTEKIWYSDISKAKKDLNYSPKISLKEGVKKTVEYYKKKGYL